MWGMFWMGIAGFLLYCLFVGKPDWLKAAWAKFRAKFWPKNPA